MPVHSCAFVSGDNRTRMGVEGNLMATHDLSKFSWTLSGWRPYSWRLGSPGADWDTQPDVGPVEARVPASVQQCLLEAGILEDWHVGLNSRHCEWVEHRHWVFTTGIPAGLLEPGERVVLDAQGLDHAGWVLVDGQEAAHFSGSLVPHRFDLTQRLGDGQSHRLSILFEEPPREQGQMGYTSRSRHFKARYNYSWDWCPRFVPIGVWDTLTLKAGWNAAIELTSMEATLEEDNQTGRMELSVSVAAAAGGCQVTARILDEDREIASSTVPVESGTGRVSIESIPVEPWWPNGEGKSRLYDVAVSVHNADGEAVWECRRRAGFKRVQWLPCEGAPDGAEPWLCEVNGRPVFLQGVNWTPARVGYHDTTVDEYATLIGLYREMGCTCLRVWGGAILEKEVFYDLCDEAGILVWQELPLSSSGIENAPPDGGAVIAKVCAIAESYIRRRAHHVSFLLWSGGNELTVERDGVQQPADYTHPCMAALRGAIRSNDPNHRFIPTSPSGPRFSAAREEFAQGVHHDVHGPWGIEGFVKDLDDWRAYWKEDDALFRSEVGMPGAADTALIARYSDGMQVVPAEGEYWRHTAAWWTQWARVKDRVAEGNVEAYVELTQREQAEAYATAAASCKERFPRCGGFLVWMGHDCFPCPANNSIIDFDRNPKPAYHALEKVFQGE